MKATDIPNGLGGVGYAQRDIPALTEGAYLQRRLLNNAPRAISKDALADLYHNALAYW
jgi:alcohol dehydrogenase class IV